MVLVWRIMDDSPNSPNFPPAKLSRYTVGIHRVSVLDIDIDVYEKVHTYAVVRLMKISKIFEALEH